MSNNVGHQSRLTSAIGLWPGPNPHLGRLVSQAGLRARPQLLWEPTVCAWPNPEPCSFISFIFMCLLTPRLWPKPTSNNIKEHKVMIPPTPSARPPTCSEAGRVDHASSRSPPPHPRPACLVKAGRGRAAAAVSYSQMLLLQNSLREMFQVIITQGAEGGEKGGKTENPASKQFSDPCLHEAARTGPRGPGQQLLGGTVGEAGPLPLFSSSFLS